MFGVRSSRAPIGDTDRRVCFNVPRDIAERTLGHAIPGVEGVYDRHKYVAEKSDALQRLAEHVASILNPPDKSNVIRMKNSAV